LCQLDPTADTRDDCRADPNAHGATGDCNRNDDARGNSFDSRIARHRHSRRFDSRSSHHRRSRRLDSRIALRRRSRPSNIRPLRQEADSIHLAQSSPMEATRGHQERHAAAVEGEG